MIKEVKTKAEGEFTDYSGAVLVQDDVQCYRIVLDCNQQLDGASFQVTAKRADGEVIQDIGTISGSRAEYVVANNMYAVMGEVIFRLTLVGADGSVLTAKELICNVVEANGEADLTGDDRVPALSALIAQASQAAAATDAANQAAQTANAAADAANEAAQAASSVSSQIGDLDDLATNEKTNLVGAINELADFDEFTPTETNYICHTSKRNVFVVGTNSNPEYNTCEIWGTAMGQIITVYNASFKGSTKDVVIINMMGGGEVTIAIGESHTFLYTSGYLQDLDMVAAQSIDYGNDNNFTRMSKPAKRYYVEASGTSTTQIQITELDIERDKEYYIRFGAALTPNGDDPLYNIIIAPFVSRNQVAALMGASCVNGYWSYGNNVGYANIGSGAGLQYLTGTMRIVKTSVPGEEGLESCCSYSGEGFGYSGTEHCATQLYGVIGESLNMIKLTAEGGPLVAGSFIEITTV